MASLSDSSQPEVGYHKDVDEWRYLPARGAMRIAAAHCFSLGYSHLRLPQPFGGRLAIRYVRNVLPK